jgi:pyruvate formate lyase activating enzyme
MNGTIFNIQRFSIHDGPGIRTTVFLKGCSLRCFWCHNPEGIRRQRELQLHPELCIACEACVEVCPVHAHSVVDGQKRFERSFCKTCGACAESCVAGALVMAGESRSVEQIMQEVLKDRAFYRNSGGGVTLSGGEPLMQPQFSRAILQACRREGIHTAVETSGNAPWRDIDSLLPFLDLLLMDIKHMDAGKHRRATGAGNELILANARRLAQTEMPIVFRLPVIPTVNDSPQEVEAAARFVRQLRDARKKAGSTVRPEGRGTAEIDLELLAFHPLGAEKYRGLDMANPAEGLAALPDHIMESFRKIVGAVLSGG